MHCEHASKELQISSVMMPSHANPSGNVHGGEIMKIMDSAAYATSRRYARSNTVTARVDELEFHLPILVGDLVICTAKVVYVGNSSMEIAVTVEVEDLQETNKPQVALSAFFTMVALDRNGKPKNVCPLILTSEADKIAFEEGKARYAEHKAKSKAKKAAIAKAKDSMSKPLF